MLDTVLIEFLVESILTLVFLERRRCAPLRPSPKPLPLLGDAPQLREKHMWKLATSWCEENGAYDYDCCCEFPADGESLFRQARLRECCQRPDDLSQRLSGE